MRAQADRNNGVTIDEIRAELARRDRAFEAEVITPPPMDGSKTMPATPAGYWERTGRSRSPEPSDRLEDELVRNARIGGQGVGRGVAGVAGLPVDLAELGLNAGAAVIDAAAGTDLPRFENSVGSSEWIADQTARLVEAFGGDEAVIDQDEMTEGERARYAVNRFGTEGAVGGSAISRFRDVLPRSLTAPYVAPGSEARVITGDTAAGAGSGAAMQGWEEYVPEPVQDRFGLVGELVAGLAGGAGGAGALRAGEGMAGAARGTVNAQRAMPEEVIVRDPVTKMPASRRDFANAAQLMRDNFTSEGDFTQAKQRIEDYLAGIEADGPIGPGPHPTTALISWTTPASSPGSGAPDRPTALPSSRRIAP